MINLNSHILQSTIVGKTIGICLVFCFASCSQQNEKIFMGKVKNQIKVEYSGISIIIRSLDENGKEEKAVNRTKLTRKANAYYDEEHHIILSLKDTTYIYRSSPFDEQTVFIKKETENLFSSMRMKKVKESLERYELIEAIYYTSDFQIKSFVEYQNVVFECK